jgi:hypothetical protein
VRRDRRGLALGGWRLLLVNAGLDAVYIATGLAVTSGRGGRDTAARGHGPAMVVQDAFLIVFDAAHAARVPVPTAPRPERAASS